MTSSPGTSHRSGTVATWAGELRRGQTGSSGSVRSQYPAGRAMRVTARLTTALAGSSTGCDAAADAPHVGGEGWRAAAALDERREVCVDGASSERVSSVDAGRRAGRGHVSCGRHPIRRQQVIAHGECLSSERPVSTRPAQFELSDPARRDAGPAGRANRLSAPPAVPPGTALFRSSPLAVGPESRGTLERAGPESGRAGHRPSRCRSGAFVRSGSPPGRAGPGGACVCLEDLADLLPRPLHQVLLLFAHHRGAECSGGPQVGSRLSSRSQCGRWPSAGTAVRRACHRP